MAARAAPSSPRPPAVPGPLVCGWGGVGRPELPGCQGQHEDARGLGDLLGQRQPGHQVWVPHVSDPRSPTLDWPYARPAWGQVGARRKQGYARPQSQAPPTLGFRAVETVAPLICSSEGPHLRAWGSHVRVSARVCTCAGVSRGDGETPQAPRPLAVSLCPRVSPLL